MRDPSGKTTASGPRAKASRGPMPDGGSGRSFRIADEFDADRIAAGRPWPESGIRPPDFGASRGRGLSPASPAGLGPGGSRRIFKGGGAGRAGLAAPGVGFAERPTKPRGSGPGGLGGVGAELAPFARNGAAGGGGSARVASAAGPPCSGMELDAISVSSCATALSRACASRSIASSGTGGSRARNWPKSAFRARS